MKADFGVRRLLASGRMLIESKPSREKERAAAAASEIYSPPKHDFAPILSVVVSRGVEKFLVPGNL